MTPELVERQREFMGTVARDLQDLFERDGGVEDTRYRTGHLDIRSCEASCSFAFFRPRREPEIISLRLPCFKPKKGKALSAKAQHALGWVNMAREHLAVGAIVGGAQVCAVDGDKITLKIPKPNATSVWESPHVARDSAGLLHPSDSPPVYP